MARLFSLFFTTKQGRSLYLALLLVFVSYLALIYYPGEVWSWIPRPGINGYEYELRTYDTLLKRLKPVTSIDPRIRIIGADTVSLQVFGQWPWPRATHGRLIERISSGHGAGIAFDFMFVDPSSNGDADDAALATSIAQATAANKDRPFVVLADHLGSLTVEGSEAIEGQISADVAEPREMFVQAGAVTGFIDADTSQSRNAKGDASVRRARLARKNREGKLVPSLDLALTAVAMKVPLDKIEYGNREIRVGDLTIPTSDDYELNISYYMVDESVDELSPIPYARMLGEKLPDTYVGSRIPLSDDLIKDGIFIAGATAPDLGDDATTPGGRVPGVFVHAQIMNTILQHRFIRDTSPQLYLAMMILMPLIVILLMLRTSGLWGFVVALAMLIALWETTQILFLHGWWLRPMGPTITTMLATGGLAGYQFLRGHFLLRQFITPELAHDLLMAGGEAAHTSEQECTIIFSDIRGFTTLNEQMRPTKMVELLKEYHSLTVPIYEKHGGRCLDYLGDAQMVVYGDPMTRSKEKNHAVSALAAGLEVHQAIEEMNKRWVARNDPPFDVGIGACTGVVAIGVLGADTAHLQYTVIGDVTNTAARVQGLSRDLDAPVICAESTILKAGERIVSEKIKAVPLKGKALPVTVYRVLGLKGDSATIARMREQTRGGEVASEAGKAPVSVLIGLLALAALFTGGCAGSPQAPPTPPPTVTTPATEATAGIMPVGSPSAILTISPTVRPATPQTPAVVPSPGSAGGARVTYANPPPVQASTPATPPPALPPARDPLAAIPGATQTPTSPLMGGARPAPAAPSLEGMTLPIYPNSVKSSQMSQNSIPNAQQLILVIITRDSADAVKTWYHERMKANVIVDTGNDRDHDRKIEISRESAINDKQMLDTVLIQNTLDGSTQILLRVWKPTKN